jgi:hypothetical protein
LAILRITDTKAPVFISMPPRLCTAMNPLKWLFPRPHVLDNRESVIALAAQLSWQPSDVGFALRTDYDIGQRHGRLIEACEKHGLIAFRHSKSFDGGAAVLAATDEALINSIKRETKFPVDVTEAPASFDLE